MNTVENHDKSTHTHTQKRLMFMADVRDKPFGAPPEENERIGIEGPQEKQVRNTGDPTETQRKFKGRPEENHSPCIGDARDKRSKADQRTPQVNTT